MYIAQYLLSVAVTVLATTTVCIDLRNGRVRRATARNIDFLRITVRIVTFIGSHTICVRLFDDMMCGASVVHVKFVKLSVIVIIRFATQYSTHNPHLLRTLTTPPRGPVFTLFMSENVVCSVLRLSLKFTWSSV